VVVGIGGWRYWEHVQETRAQAAAAQFEDALKLSGEDKPEEAAAALEALAKEGDTGYSLLARFRLAAERGQQNAQAGAGAYDALADDAGVAPLWRDLARLRAAWLRLDTADQAQIRQTVEPMAAPANPWRHSARELLG